MANANDLFFSTWCVNCSRMMRFWRFRTEDGQYAHRCEECGEVRKLNVQITEVKKAGAT